LRLQVAQRSVGLYSELEKRKEREAGQNCKAQRLSFVDRLVHEVIEAADI
jgi:hypothetical protein